MSSENYFFEYFVTLLPKSKGTIHVLVTKIVRHTLLCLSLNDPGISEC